ncbi:DNA cytosine methyltransferase, partial [Devosia sp.]|uniref:DNA cytosine methyltransferase n=1 Tax=Devosia sp. TaxID=1871048 RepID=UPI001AC4D373
EEEAKAYTKATGIKIIRPLAFNSEKRIALGTKRYGLDKGDDAFLALLNHGGDGFRGQGVNEGFATVTRARDAHGLVVPHLMTMRNSAKPFSAADEATHTITAGGAGLAEVEATIAPFLSHGQQGGRSRSAEEPVHTIAASVKDTNQVAAVFLAQHNGGPRGPIGRAADAPASTLTVEGSQQQVVSAFLARQFGASVGHEATAPNGTITAGGGGKTQVVSAHMISMKGSDRRTSSVEAPATASTAQGQHTGVVMPFMTAYFGSDEVGAAPDAPARTVTVKPRFGHVEAEVEFQPLTEGQLEGARRVAAFMRKYDCWDDREFVTMTVRGVQYIIVDIGMRMLTPRELARAQGFRDTYILAAPFKVGFLTETDQRHKIGNSVCPDMAYALFRRNYRPKPRLVVDNDQGWLLFTNTEERAAA